MVIRLVALLALALLLAGCSSQPTISSWQRSVTEYVRETGGNDPMALRRMTLPGNRPGFAVIGSHDTKQSHDVNGLLLGHEQVGGRMWFVYLVGLVKKERVSEIRLAAVSMENGSAVWERGKASKQALKAYRQHGLKQAKKRFPDRDDPPPRYTGFPRPDDVFKLTQSNGKLVATHEATGARWELVLAKAND